MTAALRGNFTWTASSSSGSALRGAEKYDLADRMVRIAQLAADGNADIEISYGSDSVTLVIRPKATPEMRERAREKALRTATRGLTGLLSRILLFIHGLGAEAKSDLIAKMEDKYLQQELSEALWALSSRMSEALARSALLGIYRAAPDLQRI